MPTVRPSPKLALVAAFAATLASPVSAENGKPPKAPRPDAAAERAPADKAADPDASRYCAAVAPAIVEARIAWQTKRLTELDVEVRQRIADLEKAEAAARDWIAKRDDLMKAAEDDVVAIYARMDPEAAAKQIAALDDRPAAAILAKLKPAAASAILGEMDADHASRLAGLIGSADPQEKKKS